MALTVLVVRVPDKIGERKSSSGLLIPGTSTPAPRHLAWAEVHLVGPHVRVAKPGDRVPSLPSSGLEVELDGEKLGAPPRTGRASGGIGSREGRSPARPIPLAPPGHAGTKLSRILRVLFSLFGSTNTTDCHVPSAMSPREHREGQRRGYEDRQEMVTPVPDRPVTMRVPIVAWQQPRQQLVQVAFRSGAGLHQRDTRRRVRDEYVQQSFGPRVTANAPNPVGDIDDASARRVDLELGGAHVRSVPGGSSSVAGTLEAGPGSGATGGGGLDDRMETRIPSASLRSGATLEPSSSSP